MMTFLSVRHFSYTYPGEEKPALRDINLEIDQGSFVVITGKSGCGKSTLGKALAGFLFQDEHSEFTGEIIVNGVRMDEVPLYAASERVAYVQQNPEDQFCTLTVQDEIAFGLENRCVDPHEINTRVRDALKAVDGLALLNLPLSTLSGGEKQKVAIASMLALSPDILILDEPTSNLDPIATQNVFSALHHMLESRKMTVIIIEHKLNQLLSFNPQWIVMDQGRILPEMVGQDFGRILQPDIHFNKQEVMKNILPIQNRPVVHLDQVTCEIQNRPILSDIHLDLFPGEFISLMGPNGSGKTTLLRCIMGLQPSVNGTREVFGRDVENTKVSDRVSNTGFLFQNPDHMLFTQSVWDEAVFTSRNLNLLNPSVIDETVSWLERMGLADRRTAHPNRLSYGEKRRLNLICIILHHPGLLLIDELLIGQDMENAHKWMTLLAEYTTKGNTVLLVNHHASLTQAYCNRVLMLDKGRIIIDSSVEESFTQMEHLGWDVFLPERTDVEAYA